MDFQGMRSAGRVGISEIPLITAGRPAVLACVYALWSLPPHAPNRRLCVCRVSGTIHLIAAIPAPVAGNAGASRGSGQAFRPWILLPVVWEASEDNPRIGRDDGIFMLRVGTRSGSSS